MGLEITIEQIEERTDEKYGPVTIPLGEAGTAKLLHIIQMPKPKREQFSQKTNELNKMQAAASKAQEAAKAAAAAGEEPPEFDQEGMQERMNTLIGELITILCVDPHTAQVLLERMPKFANRMTLFQVYMENAQPGEA